MMLCVGAMIGCGKTSLAEIIAEEFGTEVFYESVEDNPVLEQYYVCSDEEIQKHRYPFLLQLWFLNTRFRSIKQALVNDNNVLDRSIYEDLLFASINKELGRMSDMEFMIYQNLLENMMSELKELPKKAPDLFIYLYGSFETVLNRIKKRGREYELDDSLIEYYKLLWSRYDDWIDSHYNSSEVLKINIDHYDYVNNPEHKKEVLQLIKDKLEEVRR